MRRRRMAPIISAHEYGQITLPSSFDNANIRERLRSAGLRAGFKVFEERGRRLFAQGVVGVIDIGDVIVEILPKIDDVLSPPDSITYLGDLLRFTGNQSDLGLTTAGIATSPGGLLEVILSWTARTIAKNLSDGLPRRYSVREEPSMAIRGRVELRHVVRQRPGRSFELTVRHAPLHEDNLFGQIVRWLVDEVSQRTQNLRTYALSLRLLKSLSGVRQIVPTMHDLDRLVPSAMESHWFPIIELAKTFLSRGTPNPARGGGLQAVAVLFTLHNLFEAAVRRVFREGLGQHGMKLQKNTGYLLTSASGGAGQMRLLPDFRIGRSTSAELVGDAKWKRIFDGPGLPRLSESDVYQVVSYMAALGSNAGFIVCPLSGSEQSILRHSAFAVSGLDRSLSIVGVRLQALILSDARGSDLRENLCRAAVNEILSATNA